MTPNPLFPFLEAAKAKGASDEFLFRLLAQRGWPASRIYEGFAAFYEQATGMPIPGRPASAGAAARDAFLYLVAFLTLGIWAIALGSLLFTFVDRWLPGATAGHTPPPAAQTGAGELAAIIVAFPIYLAVTRLIVRDLAAHPEKSESGVRHWLTYLAMFIAAGVVIGDLMSFLTYLLQGGLTAPFLLKSLAVLLIAGGIFWYYLAAPRRNLPAAALATLLVAAAVVVGITTLGAPAGKPKSASPPSASIRVNPRLTTPPAAAPGLRS